MKFVEFSPGWYCLDSVDAEELAALEIIEDKLMHGNTDYGAGEDAVWVAVVEIYKLNQVLVWRKNKVMNLRPSLSDAETMVHGVLREYLNAEAIYSDELEIRFKHRKVIVKKVYDLPED